MKGAKKAIKSAPSREQLRALIEGVPVHELHRVRPQMVEMGQRLLENPNYPSGKVVGRLAELFASRLMAERN